MIFSRSQNNSNNNIREDTKNNVNMPNQVRNNLGDANGSTSVTNDVNKRQISTINSKRSNSPTLVNTDHPQPSQQHSNIPGVNQPAPKTKTGVREALIKRFKHDDDDNNVAKQPKKKKKLRDSFRETWRKYRNRISDDASSGSVLDHVTAFLAFIGNLIALFFRSIWRFMIGVAVVILCCVAVGAVGIGFLVITTVGDIPSLEDYELMTATTNSTIYDVDGEVIGVISVVDRQTVTSSEIAPSAKDATVAIEDERFYDHDGVDFIGILRALYYNYQSWVSGSSSTQGGSTITQQYVRNAYENVGFEQTVSRKLTEIFLAVQLEATMSKDDILTSYLNTVYYGNGCYGIEAASQYYFGHAASELSYYESAMLAAILQSPTRYNPTTEDGLEANRERALIVLDKMYSLGYLDDLTYEEFLELKQTDPSELLDITERETTINQPYYYDYVMSELRDIYTDEEIEEGGWQIYTTLSIEDGEAAAEIVSELEEIYGDSGITAAIADVDVETGAVNAFCGGTDYSVSQYNIATSSQLQAGSSLKPFVYAAACEYYGYYMTDKFSTEAIDIGTDGDSHVITSYIGGSSATLREGVIQSDNAMAIRMGLEIGVETVNDLLQVSGFAHELDDNVVSLIGGTTTGFTPLEIATGYATIANGGMANSTWCISLITDSLGNTVYEHESDERYAMAEEVALQVTEAMTTAVEQASWYNIEYDDEGWEVAAKTGTTNDVCDSWCVGFTTTRAVSLWMGGRDAKISLGNTSNAHYYTTTAFSDYFYAVGSDDPKEKFDEPAYKTTVPEADDGETLEEYITRVTDLQLEVTIEYVNSSSVEEGGIVDVPDAGELVDRGNSVTVQVSSNYVNVPDFVGMTPTQAYNSAAGLDISWDVTYTTSGSTTPTITAQSIDAGEAVQNGESIVLTVSILTQSASNSMIQVPELASDSVLSELKEQVETLQSELEELQSGDGITGITIPNVSGLTASQARQVLTSLGLTVSYSGSSSTTIVSTSPVRGTVVETGSTVTLNTSSSSSNNSSSSSSSTSNSTNSSSTSSSDASSSRSTSSSDD